ncbi:MAG: hypothetical protein OXL97_08525 [Chloroflexota bacterium]|nr:hypothetical protein [Chloroflexota bacterium]MDE2883839.1 hypothetical protein [Chloroflexota bacterium]
MSTAQPASSPSAAAGPALTAAESGLPKFGEVVEASVDRVVGQCHTLYGAPPLGTLVRVGSSLFAVVDGVSTAALDPGRRVIARGAELASESDVYAENPQLERLLRTDVTLTVVGHEEGGRFFQHLPPLPPRIHTFLYACSGAEVRAFMERSDWTALVLASALPTADDVLAAALREAAPEFDDPRAFLVQACRAIAAQLPTDAARLAAIMRRLPVE